MAFNAEWNLFVSTNNFSTVIMKIWILLSSFTYLIQQLPNKVTASHRFFWRKIRAISPIPQGILTSPSTTNLEEKSRSFCTLTLPGEGALSNGHRVFRWTRQRSTRTFPPRGINRSDRLSRKINEMKGKTWRWTTDPIQGEEVLLLAV